jgi:hypothetical protein
VYPSVRGDLPAAVGEGASLARRWTTVSRNVVFLGLTSLFTDISSEMLTAVLPLYFVLELRMTPLQFGVIDGLYQGSSALVRLASGVVADAGARHKTIATFGYALSAVCKVGLLAVGSAWTPITLLMMADRLGKGIRTAPRDALITLSSEPATLGTSFGVHRALDTVGALVGPLVAFAILRAAPGAYDAVFVASFAFAIVGLAVIGLFVRNQTQPRATSAERALSPRWTDLFRSRQFSGVVIAGALLGLLTASDALIYLLIQRRSGATPTLFPLFFVGTAAVYCVLALPFGQLADRLGRHRLFIGGHVFVVVIYLLLSMPRLTTMSGLLCLGLLGAYYAATDGVLPALASSVLPPARLTTGLAVVSTVAALARLLAASLFGALWTWWDASGALLTFLCGLVAAMALGALLLQARRPWTHTQEAA